MARYRPRSRSCNIYIQQASTTLLSPIKSASQTHYNTESLLCLRHISRTICPARLPFENEKILKILIIGTCLGVLGPKTIQDRLANMSMSTVVFADMSGCTVFRFWRVMYVCRCTPKRNGRSSLAPGYIRPGSHLKNLSSLKFLLNLSFRFFSCRFIPFSLTDTVYRFRERYTI